MIQPGLVVMFNEAIDEYLRRAQPFLNMKKLVMKMNEREIRDQFATSLEKHGHSAKIEGYYPNSSSRADIVAMVGGRRVFVEIKQSAIWTDSILKKDMIKYEKFSDLKKYIDGSDLMAFFCLNINPKYFRFPKEWEYYNSPLKLPCPNIGLKALSRYWTGSIADEHKGNFRLSLKEYIYPRPQDLTEDIIVGHYGHNAKFNAFTLSFVSDKDYL